MQNGGSGAEAADRAFLSSVERPSPQPSEVVLNQLETRMAVCDSDGGWRLGWRFAIVTRMAVGDSDGGWRLVLEPKAEASADLNHIILIRVLFTTAE